MQNWTLGSFVVDGSISPAWSVLGQVERLEGEEAVAYVRMFGGTLNMYGYMFPCFVSDFNSHDELEWVYTGMEWEEPAHGLSLADAEEIMVEDATHLLWVDVPRRARA